MRMKAMSPSGVQVGWRSDTWWPLSHWPSQVSGSSGIGCVSWRMSLPLALITNTALCLSP